MLIYIASFAGLLSTVVLAVVYLADRYEREPIELIQNCFLFGFVVQLGMVILCTTFVGQFMWVGSWLLITVAGAALCVPFFVRDLHEMDEPFDGVVYTVAYLAGATCVIHLNNLPQLAATSPFHDAIDEGAVPGLRDLLIVDTSPVFAAELGRGLVVILAGVLIGVVLGVAHGRAWSVGKTVVVCGGVGLVAVGTDVVAGGSLVVRAVLATAAIAAAVVVKRRSVFKERPEAVERDVLVMALKTMLMVLGAALLAMALLRYVTPQSEPVPETESPLADAALLRVEGGRSQGAA